MGQVKVEFTGDPNKLINAMNRASAAFDKLAKKSADTGKKSSKGYADSWGKSSKQVLSHIGSIAAGFGLAGGIQQGITQIKSLVEEWIAGMKRLAKASADAGREVTSLAMMQQPGMAADVAKAAIETGAQYGYRPAESFGALQKLQAQTGGVATGLEAFKATAKFAQYAGVDRDAAADAISVMLGTGFTGEKGARGLYAAGELSSLSPKEMAQMATTGLPGWQDPQMALAVGSQLSEIIKDPGKLGTYVARSRTGILGAKTQGIFEGLGAGEGFVERLQALTGAGITTDVGLEKAGFKERRERFAILQLLKNIPALQEKYGRIGEMIETPGLLETKRRAAEEEIPQMEYQRVEEGLKALTEAEKKFPTTPAGKAKQREAEQMAIEGAARYLALQRTGWTVPEFAEGEMPYISKFKYGLKAAASDRVSGKSWFWPEGRTGKTVVEAEYEKIMANEVESIRNQLRNAVKEGTREGQRSVNPTLGQPNKTGELDPATATPD